MTITDDVLAALRALDTPTVCNALEIVAPERRVSGFNRRPLVCPATQQGPVVGFARTAMIQCAESSGKSAVEIRELRLRYYEYIEQGPQPGLAVIQDVEGPDRGIGAFWGEVQSNIHKALGCAGVITDGSVRDIEQLADGFFVLAGSVMPSHVWADIVAIGTPVSVAGMHVDPGDLIHADRHGCVVIPQEVAGDIPAAAAMIVRKEAVILEASRRPGFSAKDLERAFSDSDEIH